MWPSIPWWQVLLVLAVSGTAWAADGSSAHVLEGRLLAPCCWQQTLDVHESPLATELRTEIGTRLQHGENAGAIEAELVARYGEGIRAVPAGTDPRRALGIGTITAVAASGLLLFALFVRGLRKARSKRRIPLAAPDEYDERLDEELAHQQL